MRLLCQEYGVDANCSTSETIEQEPRKGITALEWAATKGHTKVVKLLLANKADVNASKHTNGSTPLHVAAQNGHTEIVKLLLANHADASARGANGEKPINAARRNQHLEIVKLLQ